MKKQLEKLRVFQFVLTILSFLAIRNYSKLVKFLTNSLAWLNLKLNKPEHANSIKELAETWINLMPQDGRELFRLHSINEETA